MDKIIKTCKVCPVGCELIINEDQSEPSGYHVEGNSCNRGKDFGIKEIIEPSRILTGRVLLKNGAMSRLPVKTTGVVPEDKIEECLKIFNSTEAISPIKRGTVIIKDILGLGVDVIAARKA
ncbi:MAG: DUF1667 domain-containing protein [Tissierellia bacterium]|nr:DUF1667 domain-containing protein [Tissierellia bacterium]